jgi:murein DD-endopeptidase MepM/ murein hydrolase activator NlpD
MSPSTRVSNAPTAEPSFLSLMPQVDPIDRADLVVNTSGPAPLYTFRLGDCVESCEFEGSSVGTSTITVELVEQEVDELLRVYADFFKEDREGVDRLRRWNVLRLHDTNYVLREMAGTRDGIELVFYDEASEDMKRYTGPIKWSRGRFTRAQGISGLAAEAGARIYIPEIRDLPPIADFSRSDKRDLRISGVGRFDQVYPAHYIDQASGRVRLSAAQVRSIAESAGLPPLAFEQIAHGESQYYPGVVQRDSGNGMVGYGLWQITPNAWGSSGKLLKKLKDLGGIPAMRNPIKNAAMAKYMFDDRGLQPWHGTKFLTAEARAQAVIHPNKNFQADGTVDRAHVERYEFSVAARENYWDAAERFAGEVRWSRFAVFNHLVYASDTELAQAGPYEVDLRDDWIDDFSWTVTSGRRIDQVEITGRLAALLPPGAAVKVGDYGPLKGTWLVRNITRDLLDPECGVKIALGRPQRPLPEPASTVRTVAPRDPDRKKRPGERLVAAPLDHIISDSNGWNPRAHDGVDLICAEKAPLYAICDALVIDVRAGGWWGKSPTGNVALGDGIIQLECAVNVGPFKEGMHFGYGHAEAARVKVGDHVRAGQVIGRAGFANAWHVHFMVNNGATTRGIGDRDPKPFVDYAVRNGGRR